MRRLAIPLLAALVAACGGAAQKPPQPVVLTVSATGITPRSVTTRSGGAVNLVNADAVPHTLQSDCAELVSHALPAGGTWPTVLPAGPKTCNFFDADNAADPAFQGFIEVAAPGVDPGGGY